MKKILIALAALAVFAAAASATPLIGRAAPVSKPLQAFAWVNGGYNRQAKVYNWEESRYVGLGEALPVATYGAEVWAAVGLPFRSELDIIVPAWRKTRGDAKSKGIGDVTVMARHGLPIPGVVPLKATLALGANLPTSDRTSNPALDDGTFDFGAGLTALAGPFGRLAGHARAAYWLSGKTDDTTRVGNLLEYVAVLDFSVTKAIIPEVALSGSMRAPKEVNGATVANSEVVQHYASLLLLTRPLRFLVVRPKVGLPLEFVSRGGSLPAFTLGLDVWASLP